MDWFFRLDAFLQVVIVFAAVALTSCAGAEIFGMLRARQKNKHALALRELDVKQARATSVCNNCKAFLTEESSGK